MRIYFGGFSVRRFTSVGLFSVMVPALLALPVTTAPAGPKPQPVRPAVQSLVAEGVDPAVIAADAGAPLGKGRPFVLTGKRATDPFSMVGITWQPGSGSAAVEVSVRTRGEDGWSPWSKLEVADDDGPDADAQEGRRPGVRVGTAPTWVGEATGVQVRLDVPSGPSPRGVKIELIDPGTSAADDTMGQLTAPQSTATAATTRPVIISRSQWGADESLRTAAPSYSPAVKVAYVHHTASTNDYTADEAAAQVRGFYAYHTKSLGWSDIGYNFLADKFGRLYEGRYGGMDKAVIGAHAGGFNSGTMGVSMIGEYSTVAPTTSTISAVRDLLAWKLSLDGADPKGKAVLTSGGGSTSKYPAGAAVTVNVIAGHRDTNNTACPGDQGYSTLPGLRTSVADRIATTSTIIDAKHVALGGSAGLLGPPIGPETAVSGGRYRDYTSGSIYWSSASGAFEVHGSIRDSWSRLGSERSPLGFPITDNLPTGDGAGRFNHFQGGTIIWHPALGAQDVRGLIRDRWAAIGWERSPIGYPTTGEGVTSDGAGRFNHFQGGTVVWTPALGAQDVRGRIRDRWAAIGWEKSPIGYPITGEGVTGDRAGRFNHFQGGTIVWTPSIGARDVRGAIRDRWAATGWERGPLGYPVSNEYDVPGGKRNDFQRGSIVWNARTGATMIL
jgi:uncharacterized protein with LGFP repeats